MVIRMIEYDFAVIWKQSRLRMTFTKIYFPHSCVLYLRGKGRKDTLSEWILSYQTGGNKI